MKVIRFGFIGTNFISDLVAEEISKLPFCKIASIYSRKKETSDIFADKHNIKHRFTDMEDFLSCGEIDAVYVASPNSLHASQSIAALSHGLHVLCEKPFASNEREAREVFDAAKKHGRVVMEAMRSVHDVAFEKIADTLPLLGTIRRISLEFCQYSSRYDSFKAGEIKNAFNPELSNAAVMDIGVYPIELCIALFGMPKKIQSHSVILHNGMEGCGSALLSYDTAVAEISYSKISDSVNPSVITGEDASIVIGKISSPQEIFFCERGRAPLLIHKADKNNVKYELAAFANAINGTLDTEKYKSYTLETMRVIDEIRRQNGIVFPADRQ